ncbi:regulatory protein RecX [Amphritea balenae]|uniref:Regulatory protein RecX n=1 Tax=Amphritea balenae TaxID=452629 RepID=A0A3P1SN44_9GAMM|nr:regulatory protein RecX [Amphritea balenae]RRC98671.1 regulatory protein RecX [Amphritea balenae]GGK66442.1 regulatory protein RecX [Amphritea balenae]
MYESEQEAKNAAIGLLARREHSRKELMTKLQPRCQGFALEPVLDLLEDAGYLSDLRFSQSFIRMRVSQGHGEIRIRFDLRQKGISSEMINTSLEEAEIDWFEQALELYCRKYRTAITPQDFKERSKRMRFMAQRGFSMEQINYSIEQSANNDH